MQVTEAGVDDGSSSHRRGGPVGQQEWALSGWGSKLVADEVLMMLPDPCLTMIG